MMKHIPPKGKLLLLEIMNDIWNSGKVPQQWKRATIKPADSIESYRPVSLTSCAGKVLKKVIGYSRDGTGRPGPAWPGWAGLARPVFRPVI